MLIDILTHDSVYLNVYSLTISTLNMLASSQTIHGFESASFLSNPWFNDVHSLVYIKICMNHINQSTSKQNLLAEPYM